MKKNKIKLSHRIGVIGRLACTSTHTHNIQRLRYINVVLYIDQAVLWRCHELRDRTNGQLPATKKREREVLCLLLWRVWRVWHTIDAKHVYRSTRSANVECIFFVAILLISFFSFFFWRMTDFLASDIQSIATKMPSARNPQSMTEKKWQRWPNDFPESKNSTFRIARAPFYEVVRSTIEFYQIIGARLRVRV